MERQLNLAEADVCPVSAGAWQALIVMNTFLDIRIASTE